MCQRQGTQVKGSRAVGADGGIAAACVNLEFLGKGRAVVKGGVHGLVDTQRGRRNVGRKQCAPATPCPMACLRNHADQ